MASLAAVQPALANPPELQLPIACTPGKDCFVQNYPDDAPANVSGQDFACGAATYHGHDGTDIRVLSIAAARGVQVLAAAPGVVRGARDGVADHLMRNEADKAAVKGRECGNGVAITHADGWETQYCHMHLGSIRVKAGQKVEAGTVLGEVGQSGETQFAHVHLTVRHGRQAFDPFTGKAIAADSTGTSCHANAANASLWAPEVRALLGNPATEVIETGFAELPPTLDGLEEGHAGLPVPTPSSPAVLLFTRIMHLRVGDRVHAKLISPSAPALEQTSEPSARNNAVQFYFWGRKRGAAVWPPGSYRGHVEVLRAGAVVASGDAMLTLP